MTSITSSKSQTRSSALGDRLSAVGDDAREPLIARQAAIATGDLSRKITVDVRGEILEPKDTINTMVDQLNAFASEVSINRGGTRDFHRVLADVKDEVNAPTGIETLQSALPAVDTFTESASF